MTENEPKENFPEVEFFELLFCPHCGLKLFSDNERFFGIGKCPHLLLTYLWDEINDSMLLAIRPDYAKVLLANLIESDSYKSALENGEYEPIGEDLQDAFLDGTFNLEDPKDWSAAVELTTYFPSPHRDFPYPIPKGSAIFKKDGFFSGLRIIVTPGSINESETPVARNWTLRSHSSKAY